MNQLSLFDPQNPITHANDPATSAVAAEQHTRNGKRQRHLEIVLGLVRECPGQTAIELWAGADWQQKDELKEPQEVRRRLTDLLSLGLVRQGDDRKCQVRNTRMVTWFAV